MSLEIEENIVYKTNLGGSVFKEILDQQYEFKDQFSKIKLHHIDTCILTIILKDNEIKEVLQSHRGFFYPQRKANYIKLIEDTLKQYKIKDGIININIGDIPKQGMFNFCREIDSKYFLLPNFRFLNDDIIISENKQFDNFQEQSEYLFELGKHHKYKNKLNKVYFAGGVAKIVRQEYYQKCIDQPDKYKGVIYCEEDNVKKMTEQLKQYYYKNDLLTTTFVPYENALNYKYLLYIDSGHSISDRMRLLLASNSVIIKKDSIYEEFYYYLLKDKENFYSIQTLDELDGMFKKLQTTEPIEKQMQTIKNNREFVKTHLGYDNILAYTASILNIVL